MCGWIGHILIYLFRSPHSHNVNVKTGCSQNNVLAASPYKFGSFLTIYADNLNTLQLCKSSCKLTLPQDLALLVAADVEGGEGWSRQGQGRQTWKPATQPEEIVLKN